MRFTGIIVGLLAAGTALGAGEKAPVPAALRFFSDLKSETVPVEELIAAGALSPFCGEAKRERIAERLARVGRRLRQDAAAFTAAGKRVDGDFAGVLVAAESPYNPLEVEVYALGLRHEDGAWKAAPVLGSFENSFVGFDDALEKRLAALERWMNAERILRLRDLRDRAEKNFVERMSRAVPAELLKDGEPREIMEAFVEACTARDLAAVLVFLGGADRGDAEERAKLRSVVSNGLQPGDERGQWRLLTSPEVVRVMADERRSGNTAEVAMLFYEPGSDTPVKLARFNLRRRADRWRVDLPEVFRLTDHDELRLRTDPWLAQDEKDTAMRNTFGTHFEKARPPRREPGLEETGVAVEGILRDGSLEEFFRFLHRHEDLDDGERRIAYAEAAQLWSAFREEGRKREEAILLDTIRRGGAGVLVFSVVSSSHLDRIRLTPVLLLEDDDGWGIAPGVTSRGNFSGLAEEAREDLAGAFAEFTDRRDDLQREAASHFLERFARAAPAGGTKASGDEVRALVTGFRALLRKGELLQASGHCALLDRGEGAWEALKSLSYEYRGVRHGGAPDKVLGVRCEGPWAAVSLRVDPGPGGEPDYPMYLVAVTGDGPRIVLDAGLRLAANKGREILNAASWKRIDAVLGKDEAGLVRDMFRAHVGRSTADRKEWLKSTRSSP